MNRDFILKNFFNKLKLAKQQNSKNVILTVSELNDLGDCIIELLSEYYNKTFNNKNNDNNDNDDKITMDGGTFNI